MAPSAKKDLAAAKKDSAAAKKTSAANASSVVPLLCTLCEHEPVFTDTSHLLTHISSKGHLAHRQKLELRSRRDPESQRLITIYEAWYARYGVRELLEERQLAKDQAEEAELQGRKALKRTRKPKAKVVVDDETNNMVKSEPRGKSQENDPEEYSDDDGEDETPASKRRSGRVAKKAPRYERYLSDEADTPEESVDAETALVDPLIDPKLNDKLKGPRFDGMGIWDAASPSQQRKRNQKKDSSVLEGMIRTSQTVTRDYYVWNLNDGSLRLERTRDIYATPSVDGSPERDLGEGNSDDKKKRGRRTKAASSTAKAKSSVTQQKTPALAKGKAVAKQTSSKKKTDDTDELDQDNHVEPAAGAARHTHGTREDLLAQFSIRPGRVVNRSALGAMSSNISSSSGPARQPAKKSASNQTSSATQFSTNARNRNASNDDDPLAFPRRTTTTPGNPFSYSRHNNGGNVNPLQIQRPRHTTSFAENSAHTPVTLSEDFTPGPGVSQFRVPRMPNGAMGNTMGNAAMGNTFMGNVDDGMSALQVPITAGQRMTNANMGEGVNGMDWMHGNGIIPQHVARQLVQMATMNGTMGALTGQVGNGLFTNGQVGLGVMNNTHGPVGNGNLVPVANMGIPMMGNGNTSNASTGSGHSFGGLDLSPAALAAAHDFTLDASEDFANGLPEDFQL